MKINLELVPLQVNEPKNAGDGVFLASDHAKSIAKLTININGGQVMHT